MTIERGSHSGSNFSLKSRSDWIWKNGLSAFATRRWIRPPIPSVLGLVEEPAPGGEVEREALDAARPEAERGVGDQVLGEAVRGVGPAPHQVERVAGIGAVAGHEPQEARDPALAAPLAGDREHEVLFVALDVLAELHREAALLGAVAPLLADLVELVDSGCEASRLAGSARSRWSLPTRLTAARTAFIPPPSRLNSRQRRIASSPR